LWRAGCCDQGGPSRPQRHDIAGDALRAIRPSRGHISELRATCAAVFEDGLPDAKFEADHSYFSFLEYYGPDFNPQTGLGTVEVWVAIKR
jgi:predicted transcriptional regulator YdeE